MYFLSIRQLALICLVLLTACNANEAEKTTEAATDTAPVNTEVATPAATPQMPAFTMLDATNQAIDLQSFAGKKVFVNLWATWCPPCRVEMPSIEKLYGSVDKEKTAFVMLSLDDDFEKAKKYMVDEKLSMPVYYPNGAMPDLFNVRGIPATFIFDEKGQLIKSTEGSDNYDTDAYRQLLK
jgi:thiol-disulfide isomerase/thioredoxin